MTPLPSVFQNFAFSLPVSLMAASGHVSVFRSAQESFK
jgi:hypothetical protein